MVWHFFDKDDAHLWDRTDAASFVVYERDFAFEAVFPPRDDFPLETGQRIAWLDDDEQWQVYEIDNLQVDAFKGGVTVSGVHLAVAEMRDVIRTSVTITNENLMNALDTILNYTPWVRGTIEGDSGSSSTVQTYKVTGNAVYLRAGPGTSYKALTAYTKGTIVTLISSSNANWSKVEGPVGRVGSMRSTYLADNGSSSGPASSGSITIEQQKFQRAWDIFELFLGKAELLPNPRVEIPADGSAWSRIMDLHTTEPEYRGIRISCRTDVQDARIQYDSSTQYSRMYGIGKDELTFADVVWTTPTNPVNKPSGQRFVQLPDDEAALLTRNGAQRVGVVFFDDEDNASELLQSTWDKLQKLKDPQITVDAIIADLYKMGYGGQSMRLYDSVQLLLEPINRRIMARIIDLERDLVRPENTRPIIGTALGKDILDDIRIISSVR